jgi:alpha-mannosidase
MLRASLYPDPDADQGVHTFAVSVTPVDGIAGAVRAGYELNLPMRIVRGSREVTPLVTVSDPAVVVEAVKLAEDRSGDVIVRLYESLGRRIRVTVTAGFDTAGFTVTDLLERPLAPSPTSASAGQPDTGQAGQIRLELRPFELVTLRLRRAD